MWSEAWEVPLSFWQCCTSSGRVQGRSCEPRRSSTFDKRLTIRALWGAETKGNSRNFARPWLWRSIWDDGGGEGAEAAESLILDDFNGGEKREDLGGEGRRRTWQKLMAINLVPHDNFTLACWYLHGCLLWLLSLVWMYLNAPFQKRN